MKAEHKKKVLNRLKTVRGHLDAVITMVEDERYCPQVMKQISALQSALEKANRHLLQNHLETCVPRAIEAGHGQHIVEELMETLRYTDALTGPAPAAPRQEPTMLEKTLTVPDMTCGHCKASIEGALAELGGVETEVRLEEKLVKVRFEPERVGLDKIVAAIEGQGFDVTQTV